MKPSTKVKISNAGTVAEEIVANADQIAGRDINNYNLEMKEIEANSKPLFSKINLSPYSPEKYLAPIFTPELLSKVEENRVLIVNGGQGFDKGDLTRHLAFCLKSHQTVLTAQELIVNNENQSLLRSIKEEKEEKIYVLDQLHPRHIQYDIEKLCELARQNKSYFLITTKVPIESWDLTHKSQEQHVFTVPFEGVYSSNQLQVLLTEGIKNQEETLQTVLPVALHDAMENKILGKGIDELAEDLDTPENIRFFISQLCREKTLLTSERLAELIELVQDSDQSLITKWFRELNHRQKLVVLGASLLEGMYEDQFFSVMEEIVESFWKHSDPSLLALDYIDLEFLWDFFKFETTSDGNQVLKNRFDNQRTDIIKTAWSTHRRHILATLPTLVKIVNSSVKEKASNWEKYGTRGRQINIRLAIGSTIADVGLVSSPSVENALVELASQENTTLQRVAAKSLARWRELGQDAQLFGTLKDWFEDQRIQNLLDDFLARRDDDNPIKVGSNASSYLKATAVLALKYSANDDSPNHLNSEIVDLIKKIAIETDGLVRTRIREALPTIIHHHVLQLKTVLVEELIKYDDLAKPIGDGLAIAYYDYPDDLKTTLFQWLTTCLESSSKSNQRKKFTYRDKVLVTVFETFERIEFNTDSDVIKIDEVYEWLLKFSRVEKRRTVRESLFLTLGKIISLDWTKAERNLSKFFTSNNLYETKFLVEKFTLIYLEQRRSLEGAKHEIRWKEDQYPTWISYKDRPFTEIERVMLDWMDKGDLVLKQISTLSFLNFAKNFEEEELEQIELLKDQLQKQRIRQSTARVTTKSISSKDMTPNEPAISFWTRIYIFFLLLFESKDNKLTLKAILKLLYKYPDFSRNHLHLVFIKWVRSSNKTTLKLANWLSRLVR